MCCTLKFGVLFSLFSSLFRPVNHRFTRYLVELVSSALDNTNAVNLLLYGSWGNIEFSQRVLALLVGELAQIGEATAASRAILQLMELQDGLAV